MRRILGWSRGQEGDNFRRNRNWVLKNKEKRRSGNEKGENGGGDGGGEAAAPLTTTWEESDKVKSSAVSLLC